MLEIQLPDMEGIEVLNELRRSEIDIKIPVIAMTANAMKGDREHLLEAGCNGYIEKAIDTRAVISQIKTFLGEAS